MEHDQILRAIISFASDVSLVRRAGQELRRSEHSPDTLWRIYRQALQDPSACYPDDVRAAMEQYGAACSNAAPENRTVTIRFRCTENQRNIIEMLASREGKTISDFIRDRCLKY